MIRDGLGQGFLTIQQRLDQAPLLQVGMVWGPIPNSAATIFPPGPRMEGKVEARRFGAARFYLWCQRGLVLTWGSPRDWHPQRRAQPTMPAYRVIMRWLILRISESLNCYVEAYPCRK